MIATLACIVVMGADKLVVGQKWSYTLTWHFKNKEIDTTDEESFIIEVTKVLPESSTIQVSQKLLATLIDGNRIPTDIKAAPAKSEWALFPNGAIAFMPDGRFGLESRFYRILKGILPEPVGDPSRDREWSLDMPDDGQGLPKAALAANLSKRTKEGRDYFLSYREANGTNGLGRFVRPEKGPFPSILEIHFTNTKMPGGTDVVNCDFTMKLNPAKSDK